MRTAAGTGGRDDIGPAVAVVVGRADADAAAEAAAVGEEVRQQVGRIRAAEDPHVRAAAGAGAGDDVGPAIAVEVARRHVDAAGEAAVGLEGRQFGCPTGRRGR